MRSKSKNNQILIVLIPFLLALIIMTPRLLSPQFGLLDDSATLSQAQRFLNGDFSMSHDLQAGRFRPVYWLYYTLIYALVGYQPFWFFLGNLTLLFILLIEIRLLVKHAEGKEWQAALVSSLFLLSMPLFENFYTISKGEPLQLVLILGAILIAGQEPSKASKFPWIKVIVAAILLTLATLVKETALLILPLTILWAILPLVVNTKKQMDKWWTPWVKPIAALLALAAYFGLRSAWKSTSLFSGTYTDRYFIDPNEIVQKALRWFTQIAFNFHYYLPFLLLLIGSTVKSKVSQSLKINLLHWVTWWLIWIAVYLPWEYAETYYLLPFALGGAMVIGLVLPSILQMIKHARLPKQVMSYALIILTGALFILTIPNMVTNARIQLTFDRVNNWMLAAISADAPRNAEVLINLETIGEYSENVSYILKNHLGRYDINYANIDDATMPAISAHINAYVLVPRINNQPNLTFRAGVDETFQTLWNEIFLKETENQNRLLRSYDESFQLTNFNLPILVCKLGLNTGFCRNPDPLVDIREFIYGWDIYIIR